MSVCDGANFNNFMSMGSTKFVLLIKYLDCVYKLNRQYVGYETSEVALAVFRLYNYLNLLLQYMTYQVWYCIPVGNISILTAAIRKIIFQPYRKPAIE